MKNNFLNALVGSWEGTCQTWLEPEKLEDDSEVRGEIRNLPDVSLFRHTYDGSMKGEPRRGEETIAWNSVVNRFEISWFDSFHMNYAILFSTGEATERGFAVQGKYDTGPNEPQWGWKTVYELIDEDHLTITAYNIPPGEQEAKAVETKYIRKKPV